MPEVVCSNCGDRVSVNTDRTIRQFVREAGDRNPAAHLITEDDLGGTWLLHRCPIATHDEQGTRRVRTMRLGKAWFIASARVGKGSATKFST